MNNTDELFPNESQNSFKGLITTLLSDSYLEEEGFELLEVEDLELCKDSGDKFVHRYLSASLQ